MSVSFNLLDNTILYFGQDRPVSEMMSPCYDSETDFWRRACDHDFDFTPRDTSWITGRSKSRIRAAFKRANPFITMRTKARRRRSRYLDPDDLVKPELAPGLEMPILRRQTNHRSAECNAVCVDGVERVSLDWETICDLTAVCK
jgi:hypothetical protein